MLSNALFNHFVDFQKSAVGDYVPVWDCVPVCDFMKVIPSEQTDFDIEVDITSLADNGVYVQAL